ncbi:Short-chain dehydrogenase [Sphingobium sp. AP50]|uniref:SDR family NAD(P)-dependent oxidoreductase n=1 Tax=Sphingobium sp. AP50 TaxID=1884369 RepID=UPI0008C5F24C|nr:SDR family oxidoreductase [Sphingobium sp. AP50]SEJ98985.1 Short-chain dehydrogenase [Sphingobium sp. AP50]
MARMDLPLAGQVALVTGAGRGFGEAIALHLAAAGASVGLVARRRADVEKVAAAINGNDGKALAIAGDVTIAADVQRSIDAVEAIFGPITAFVNNAGVGWPYGPVAGMDIDLWWEAQKLHQLAPMLYLSRLLPGMIARASGRIVIITSRAHDMVIPNFSPYAIGKLVQTRLARIVDVENRTQGVRAFAMDPGFVSTDMAREGMNNPDAQAHLGFFVDMLRTQASEDNAQQGLDACGARVTQLLGGNYDALSGTYVPPDEDLNILLSRLSVQAA